MNALLVALAFSVTCGQVPDDLETAYSYAYQVKTDPDSNSVRVYYHEGDNRIVAIRGRTCLIGVMENVVEVKLKEDWDDVP